MGVGTNWFKRELGKNTGKYVSTKLFGDKHATPHKIIIAREDAKIQTQKMEFEIKNEVQKKEILNRENLNDKREQILTKTLSNNTEEVFDFGNYLLTEIKSNSWSDDEKNNHSNNFSDTCLNKLIQCKMKLDSLDANYESQYFENEIKKLKNRKMFLKYYKYVGFIILGLILFILHKLHVIK